MSTGRTADDYFQTDDTLAGQARRATKSKNKHGNPLRLPSKLSAVARDPTSDQHVYVAEATGTVRRVNVEVSPDRG